MSKYKNSQTVAFLNGLPSNSIEAENDNLSSRCKFNFSYFTEQEASQSFNDWTHEQLIDLLQKLKEFSKETLKYWINQKKFVIYGKFPAKSEFMHPKHVPIEAQWARFRLESTVRLVGFVIPGELNGKSHSKTQYPFDSNTFYIVFLDENHLFYKLEAK